MGFALEIEILTTYTCKLLLQVITVPVLISTIQKSPQHPWSLFPACCIVTSCSLAAASNSGDLSTSRTQVLSSQPPVQNWITAKEVTPVVFKVTPRHRPHRKCSSSVVVKMCLPHFCVAMIMARTLFLTVSLLLGVDLLLWECACRAVA
jgi:hypothetical protein